MKNSYTSLLVTLFVIVLSAGCDLDQTLPEPSGLRADTGTRDTVKPITLIYKGASPWNFYYVPDIISGIPVNLAAGMRYTIRSDKPVYFMETSSLQVPYILFPGDSIVIENGNGLPLLTSNDFIRTNELRLFVDMCSKFGAIRPLMKTTYISKAMSLKERDRVIEQRYIDRLNFISSYLNTNKIRDTFVGIAKKIVFYSRLNEKLNLYFLGFNHYKIVQYYQDSVEAYRSAFIHDSSFLFNTMYQTALLNLVRQSQKQFGTPDLPFLSFSRLTEQELSDIISVANDFPQPLCSFIKAEIITKILQREIDRGKDTVDLTLLTSQIEDSAYKTKISEMVHKMAGVPQSGNFSDQLMYSISENRVIPFLSVLKKNKGKFLYVDVWATWCAPCVMSLPKSKNLAEVYREELEVAFISLDEDSLRWHDFSVQNLYSEKSYWMRSAFNSSFARQFSINAIPRYMLFGRNGELLDENCLPPGNKLLMQRLAKLIDKK